MVADPWQELALADMLGETASGLWSAPRVGLSVPRQNGKNGIIEIRELAGLLLFGERILHTAHEVKTAMMAFRRLKSFFENYDDLRKMVRKISNINGQEAIFLNNGATLQFAARSKSSGRGFSVDALVLDEAQELSDETFAAILPTISASANPQTILTGTPPGPSTNGEVFTRYREGGLEGTDPRLAWLEWSADEADDPDDIETWGKANPAMGVRLAPDTIADERAAMAEDTFSMERLGMWNAAVTFSVIDGETWSNLVSVQNPDDPVAFAVDVSPDRSRASIGVAGIVNGRVHVQAIENRKGTGWIVERLAQLSEKWRPVAVVIDAGGPAASLLPDLKAARVRRVITTNSRDMAAACGSFYDMAIQGRLAHPDQPALNEALASARKRALGDAWAWHRKDATTDITPLVAVTLAAFGLARRPTAQGPRKALVL